MRGIGREGHLGCSDAGLKNLDTVSRTWESEAEIQTGSHPVQGWQAKPERHPCVAEGRSVGQAGARGWVWPSPLLGLEGQPEKQSPEPMEAERQDCLRNRSSRKRPVPQVPEKQEQGSHSRSSEGLCEHSSSGLGVGWGAEAALQEKVKRWD